MQKRSVKLLKERREYHQVIAIDVCGHAEFQRDCHELGAIYDEATDRWVLKNRRENMKAIFDRFKHKAWIDSTDFFGFPQNKTEKRVTSAIPRLKNIPKKRLLNEYINYLEERRYSPQTTRTYHNILSKLFGYFEDVSIDSFSHRQLREYNQDVIIAGSYSRVYQRQLIGALKSFMRFRELEFIERGSLEYPRRDRKLPTVLSKEEVQRILDVTVNLKHKSMLVVLYSTGIRIGELLNIRKTDLDKDRGILTIRNGKGAKDRQVQLSNKVIKKLEIYERSYLHLRGNPEGNITRGVWVWLSNDLQKRRRSLKQ